MLKSQMIRSKLFHTFYYCTRVRHTKNIFFNSPKGRRRLQSWEHKLSGVWAPVLDCVLYEFYRYCTTRTTSNARESVLFVKLLPRHTVIHRRNKSKKHNIRQKAPRAVIWIHQARYHTIPACHFAVAMVLGSKQAYPPQSNWRVCHRLRLMDLARLWI